MNKEHRIRKNEQFDQIIKQGKRIKTEPLNIFLTKNEQNMFRLGVATSKKIGNAVVRNKVRRQIKAIMRNYKKVINYDIVIVAKPKIHEFTFEELASIIADALSKTEIING